MLIGGMIAGGMIAGGMIAGSVAGHYAAKNRYESIAMEQEQQEQLHQAQAQAELQASQGQAQRSDENKNNAHQKLEKLGSLRQQGLITDEEFQKLKSRSISTI